MVPIPKRKRLLRAGRIRCEDSGTSSTIISVRDAAVGITELGVMVLSPILTWNHVVSTPRSC